jgi:1-acyl-sn-glycerol-3-phosphate acyltransferase
MNAIRSTLLYFWLWATGVPVGIMAWLVARFVSGERVYRLCRPWAFVVKLGGQMILGMRTRGSGQQHLPDGPAVLLVKHQSTWESLILPTLLSRSPCFVFKRQIARIPFFGPALVRMNAIVIDRERRTAAYATLLREGEQLLAQGRYIVIYPEGTRIPRGQRGTYQSGGARLAIGAGVPIVPVAVASARCWIPGWTKRPGVVDISFGPPISSVGKRPQQLTQEAADWIEAEMRRIDPEAYPADDAPNGAAASPGTDMTTAAPALLSPSSEPEPGVH